MKSISRASATRKRSKMKKAKIAVVTLGHYVYFTQFEGLKEELMEKGGIYAHLYEMYSDSME